MFESIEMSALSPSTPSSFCLPLNDSGSRGEGHRFALAGTYNPTWCDLCGDLIWGLYDTGASRDEACTEN